MTSIHGSTVGECGKECRADIRVSSFAGFHYTEHMKTVMVLALVIGNALCASAEMIRSKASGAWSEPKIWSSNRVPKGGDNVHIAPGHRVVYDVESPEVMTKIHVEGALIFARDRDTELNVGVVRVGGKRGAAHSGVADVHEHAKPADGTPMAHFAVGTPDAPIEPDKTARVRLHYIEGMDKEEAPVLTCRPGGRMDFHGAPLSRTWLDLGADAAAGAQEITLSEPVSGWRVGDSIIVTGDKRDETTTEGRVIVGMPDERSLTLDRPLEHAHTGSGRFRCEVANLSRNVIVESADPEGVRGHTMHHRHSAGSISYAQFARLGKKDVLGRYPIHFHLCRDTLRGESVVGVAIIDSHNRWVTVHNTHYMIVRDCVGFGSVGHGFFLEDGTEVYNVIDRNLGVHARDGKRLPDQALPFDPNDGAAFWWANGRNTFIRNTACGNETYGFRYDSQKRSNFDSHLSIRMPDGSHKKTDIRTLAIHRFEDNESHTEGLYSFAFAGTEGVGPDRRHPHQLRGTVAWNTHYALRAQLPTMLVEDTQILRAAYGIYRPWFDHHVYRNLHIAETNTEPFNRGLDDKSLQHGSVSVDGLTFSGFRRGGVPLIQLSAYNPSSKAETHIRNLKIEDRRDRSQRALVNMGGGPRVKESGFPGVPVIIHDLFGAGRHGRFVSTRSKEYLTAKDGAYQQKAPHTGDESRVAETKDAEFPELLDPIDDHPPTTVITWPKPGLPATREADGTLIVRGTTTDDSSIRRVLVNGKLAKDLDYHFHRWEVRLDDVTPGMLKLKALSEDKAGNIEKTAHEFEINVR